jgi:hypothetical protein
MTSTSDTDSESAETLDSSETEAYDPEDSAEAYDTEDSPETSDSGEAAETVLSGETPERIGTSTGRTVTSGGQKGEKKEVCKCMARTQNFVTGITPKCICLLPPNGQCQNPDAQMHFSCT